MQPTEKKRGLPDVGACLGVVKEAVTDAQAFQRKMSELWREWVLGPIGNKRMEMDLIRLLPTAWDFPRLLKHGASPGFLCNGVQWAPSAWAAQAVGSSGQLCSLNMLQHDRVLTSI